MLSRRDLLRWSSAGMMTSALSGWFDVLAAKASTSGKKHKSCILLWMDGGPSHKDTFDMKPGTANAGEFKPIGTSVPGLQICEHLPQLASLMHHGAVIRSMSTGEGAHGRAKYFMHTGYKEGQGGLVYPSLGSIVSSELGQKDFPLPSFVSVGNRTYGAGFLGAKHQPLVVNDASRGVENLKPLIGGDQFASRLGLLEELEQGFHKSRPATSAADHHTTYNRAVKLMQSKEAKAFDLSQEPASVVKAYGEGRFGQGCLLARRLVETGIPFVEVTLGGWDTHQDNFSRIKNLCGQVDPGASALIKDLKERGLLDTTLVIWMGEFGRTPKINSRGAKPGRDHYPKAWSSVLFGGGIRAGQVIGRTDKEGGVVEERPVSTIDFMATVCKTIGIDYNKSNDTHLNRPVRIVDKGAKPIDQLIG